MKKETKIKRTYVLHKFISAEDADYIFNQPLSQAKAWRGIVTKMCLHKGDIINLGNGNLPVVSWSTRYNIAECFASIGTAFLRGKDSIIFEGEIEGSSLEDYYKINPKWDEGEILTPAREQYQITDIETKFLTLTESERKAAKIFSPNKEVPERLPYYIIKVKKL